MMICILRLILLLILTFRLFLQLILMLFPRFLLIQVFMPIFMMPLMAIIITLKIWMGWQFLTLTLLTLCTLLKTLGHSHWKILWRSSVLVASFLLSLRPLNIPQRLASLLPPEDAEKKAVMRRPPESDSD